MGERNFQAGLNIPHFKVWETKVSDFPNMHYVAELDEGFSCFFFPFLFEIHHLKAGDFAIHTAIPYRTIGRGTK